jgi:hypothetical protein
MSRAAVASAGATKPLHLVVRPDMISMIVSSESYPDNSIEISPKDLCTLQMLWLLMKSCDQGRNPLFRGKRPLSEIAPTIPYSIFALILNFTMPNFIALNTNLNFASFLTRQLAQSVSVSQNISSSQLIQIPWVLSVKPVYDETVSLFNITASSFFDFNASNLTSLLNASLSADLDVIKRIAEKTRPDIFLHLLSIEGKVTTRLGRITVERTGTPLQMAIYDHDEEIAAFFKEKMDPEEFEKQSKSAFAKALTREKCAELGHRNASALEYHQAMLEQQNKDAEILCAGLENAFKSAPINEFTVDNHYVASTRSTQCLRTIDTFINKLMDYVKNNPVHNPYILQRVYEIYSRFPSGFHRDCFFSQKVIGGVQSFLSARWLQHYAQGIDYLAENNEVPPRRSFICHDSSPHIDIRHLVDSCIGTDSFLSIFGGAAGRSVRAPLYHCDRYLPGFAAAASFKNYVEQKQQELSELYAASAIDSQLHNSMK